MQPPGRATTLLACASALIVGGFVSLWTAGPALFSDGPFGSRPLVLAISVFAFAIVGFAIGLAAPGAWKPAAVCLVLSAIPVVVLLGRDTFGQMPMTLLSIGFITGDAAAGAFGVWGGARVRQLRGSRHAGKEAQDDC